MTNHSIDKLKKVFESTSQREKELLDDSLVKEPEAITILMAMKGEMDQLWRDICAGNLGKISPVSACKMKGAMQSLSFAPLCLMRGNIRSGYADLRFAIEETCNFVYLLDNNNCINLENKLKEVGQKLQLHTGVTDDKELLKAYNNLNNKYKPLVHEYIKNIDPNINEALKEIKGTMSKFLVHGDILGTYDHLHRKLFQSGNKIEPFDAEDLRDWELKRSIAGATIIMLNLHTIICAVLEKRFGIDLPMSKYWEGAESVREMLKQVVKPQGGFDVVK